jgi:sugar lactone lactonase YvrE
VIGFLLLAGPAAAQDNGHAFSSSFKPSGTAEISESVYGMDVDNSSGPSAGDLYVLDASKRRVEKFDTNGNFVVMFGGGVNQTTGGDVCTAASGNICRTGSFGSAANQFRFPQWIAVDQTAGPSAGDIYVADPEQRQVHKYDENGNLITTWGTGGVIAGSSETFRSMRGIDVDSAGQLLVSGCSENFCNGVEPVKVFKYAQDGTAEGSFSTSPQLRSPVGWSPQGYFYFGNEFEPYNLRRASATDGSGLVNVGVGAYFTPFEGFLAIAQGMSVDPVTGTVYQTMYNYEGGPGRIWEFQFDGAGQPLDSEGNPCATTLSASGEGCAPTHQFGSAVLPTAVNGIAVDSSTNRVYVYNSQKREIEVFIGAAEPIAATEGVTWRATVHGTAMPDGAGDIVECYFQYGETTNYGSKQECSSSGSLPFTADESVSADLTTLNGDGQHTYHARLVVKNEAGAINFGPDHAFIPQNVKGLQTQAAESITRTQATLKASYEDTGKETHYYFEWGASTAYGNISAAPPGPEATSTDLSADAEADGALPRLKSGTVYHYRIVAENEFGVTYGQDMTFATLPPVQGVTTEAASPVTRTTAMIHGSYLGDGTATTYQFEWGDTPSLVNSTTISAPESPSGSHQVSYELTKDEGLEYQKTYYFRLSATNELGTAKGSTQEFTTPPAVGGVVTTSATEIGQESITLNGEFNGNGEDTHYYFEYGLTTKYGQVSEEAPGSDAGSPNGTTAISSEITDYEGYETYHYRVVAVNPVGTTYGSDMTVTTLPAELPIVDETAASEIEPTAATLEAQVTPNRWATLFTFQYGPTASYGESTEIAGPIGDDQFPHPVSQSVKGLEPATIYHFRVIAINYTGTTYGPDQTFQTPDVPGVVSSSGAATGQSTAHLEAGVVPNSSPTSVDFEYGLTSAYGAATVPVPVGSGTGTQSAVADIGGLTVATPYHFRAVASNEFGTSYGPDQTVTTAAPPPPPPPPAEKKPPKKCKKGFVKKNGKCVKKKTNKNKKKSSKRHG